MKSAATAPSFPYTETQRAAIDTIDQNLQIVACAGAGKTQVLAERVVEILRRHDGKIRPSNIVAFTFTERAGAELKDRIVSRVSAELGDITGMAELYVGTIHGYCLQLLQGQIPEYFKYSVLTEVQTRLLVDRSSTQSGLTDLGLRRYIDSSLFLDVLNVVREGDVDPAGLAGHPVRDALEKYQGLLDRKRYLDYAEILVRAVAAIYVEQGLRKRISAELKYLIVDEYQDVNPLQEGLIRALHDLGANLCVVGDDDQTIYQWRGSDIRNILSFRDRYPNVKVVTIDANYRCSPAVVDTARLVIEHNNPNRLDKRMKSSSVQTYAPGDVLALAFENPDDEGAWIADQVLALIGTPFQDSAGGGTRGLALSDFAILLRSVRRNADSIVAALRRRGIPVVIRGMTNLFDSAEVIACRALFLFMARQIDKDELRRQWIAADLGIDQRQLDAAIVILERDREWRSDERWSTYNLQRTFLSFLQGCGLREENIPSANAAFEFQRAEIVYYNLGKFSQVISDFEQIHFQSDPARKYEAFAGFLEHQAPDYYPEGWQDAGYVQPNAVQVMTVHQAKGMEWPVVFVPCLIKNRFPAKAPGGKGRWHVIPRTAIRNADLFDASLEDERRLFYVALTRSQKFLFCSWAPVPTNKLFQHSSTLFAEFTASSSVLTRAPRRDAPALLPPRARRSVTNVSLSFSELKYFFECPYEFKLRFLYGFNAPLHEALGYGKSLHDALAEVHKRAQHGEFIAPEAADDLIDRHLHVPFAYPELHAHLRSAGATAVRRYLSDNGRLLANTEHAEQLVELELGDGVVVSGRIDLIRRLDTREIVVVDFKSTERAQSEDLTRMQLHIYSLGYRALTGSSADYIEIYNLDHGGSLREQVDLDLEATTRLEIVRAAKSLRENALPRLPTWNAICAKCDLAGICRDIPLVGGRRPH